MPQSFCQLYAHLVFSTHERQRWLDDNVRADVHAYMAGFLHNHKCDNILVGGTDDHVHILCRLPKTIAPADLIGLLKSESSKYVKTFERDYGMFAWQKGYGIFSVSPPHLPDVRQYINGQTEHHQKISFKEEFLAFLHRYEISYDERYVWD